MIIAGHLLISNSPNDGGIIGGTYEAPEQWNSPELGEKVAAKLQLITAGGSIELEGDVAILLFTHYQKHGTNLGRPDYFLVSREAVSTLADMAGQVNLIQPNQDLVDRGLTVISSLTGKLHTL